MASSNRFHYITYGNASYPAVLFLHGFMGNIAEWQAIIPFFSEKFYCIAVDLPGHGRTRVQAKDEYRMQNCAANLIAFLDALNIYSCRLVSYSMGGRLAFYLAVFYPHRFDKIVIESAAPGLQTEQERNARIKHDRKISLQLENLPLKRFLQIWYRQPVFSSLDKNSRLYREMIQNRMQNDSDGLSLSLHHMGTGVQPSLWDMLDKIRADVLLIVGQKDGKYMQIADAVDQRCRRSKVKIIKNAGHNAHLENKNQYVKAVDLFLNNRLKKGI